MLARVSALASAPSLCGRLASLSLRARPQQQSVLLRQLLSEEPLKPHLSYSANWPAVKSAFCKSENPGSSSFSGPSTRAIPLNVNAIGLERRTPNSKERGKAAFFQPVHHKITNRGNLSYIRCSSSGKVGEETSDLGEMVGRKADGPKRTFQIVVAATQDLGIGRNGSLPWKLPGDMRFFKQVTTTTSSPDKRNAVVMGRKTWDSIPPKFRPLPGRLNVVLTRAASKTDSDSAYPEGVLVCASLDSAMSHLASADHADKVETVFVIGGGQIYREAMASPLCDAVHLTEVNTRDTPLECDTFMPPVDPSQFRAWSASPPKVENDLRYSFVTYVRTHAPEEPQGVETNGAAVAPSGVVVESTGRVESAGGAELGAGESAAERPERGAEGDGAGSAEAGAGKSAQLGVLGKAKSGSDGATGPGAVARLPKSIQEKHEELQYLKLIDEIIREGAHKGDRTGTGTISKFGCSMRFNLRKSFPLLTTKRVFWRGVVEELLWFVAGSTNARLLQDRGVHIWDGNGSRAYLDSIGLTHREEHDLGPVYGFQWRHFGAKYTDMHADYTGQGVDQLADLIHRIKTKPEDRRLILSAWNPADLQLMALPPCHMFCQFYVADGELSCQMYQRSCDMGLGVPFNIASYSLLTLMIAQVCGLRPGDFIHVLGDAHVYTNHVEPLQEQLRNTPRPFPMLKVNPAVNDIDSFTADDFELIGYEPHKKIAMKMAV